MRRALSEDKRQRRLSLVRAMPALLASKASLRSRLVQIPVGSSDVSERRRRPGGVASEPRAPEARYSSLMGQSRINSSCCTGLV